MQDRLPFSGFVANFDGKQIQNKEELFRFLEKNVGLPDANNWSSIYRLADRLIMDKS